MYGLKAKIKTDLNHNIVLCYTVAMCMCNINYIDLQFWKIRGKKLQSHKVTKIQQTPSPLLPATS